MLRTRLNPPVVHTGSKMKNPADNITLVKSALVPHNTQSLGTSYGMLHIDPDSGDLGICHFLLRGKPFPLGFFIGWSTVTFSGSYPGILPKDA